MEPSLSTPPIATGSTTNAELAALITQAFWQAGLISTNDQMVCENMLNGRVSSDTDAWRQLLEKSIQHVSTTCPDAL